MKGQGEIDALDREIIKLLQEDGRKPYTEMAQRLGVSEGTVRSRVNRMVEEGIIEIVVHANPDRVGLHTQAIIGLSTQLGMTEEVAQQLIPFKEARFIAVSSGAYDLIIQVYVENNEKLLEFVHQKLAKIAGIVKADVSIELKVFKDTFDFV